MFSYEGTGQCVFLKIPEPLNYIIFYNSIEFLLLKMPQESTRAASVNVIGVPFSGA